jgi:Protein of unknown function (DUF1573)
MHAIGIRWNRASTLIAGTCLMLASILPARASLAWDRTSASETCWAGEETTVTVYHFRNTGTSPVKIISADPSCHCTSVDWPEKAVAPGAEGAITATFTVGGRIGQEDKTISVISDDAPDTPTVLALSINIQRVATISSDTVFWKVGEKPIEKDVEITAADVGRLTAVEAVSNEHSVSVSVRKMDAGKRFVLAITPASTDKPVQARIECRATFGSRSLPIRPAFAFVLK